MRLCHFVKIGTWELGHKDYLLLCYIFHQQVQFHLNLEIGFSVSNPLYTKKHEKKFIFTFIYIIFYLCFPDWLSLSHFFFISRSYFVDLSYAQFSSTFSADCGNILSALRYNEQKVKTIFQHFQQPPVSTASPKELVSDFGLDKVSRILKSSATNPKATPVAENQDAIIVSCSDSMGLEPCRSLQTVLTTNGLGLGFNAPNSKGNMLNKSINHESMSPFLGKEIAEM